MVLSLGFYTSRVGECKDCGKLNKIDNLINCTFAGTKALMFTRSDLLVKHFLVYFQSYDIRLATWDENQKVEDKTG